MEVSGEIRLYQSALIDESVFWHGFPERTGGVSSDERLSLNLGHRWGDAPANIQRNRELVCEHGGFAFEDLLVTKHVHGTKVWTVGEELLDPPEFDGLVSDVAGKVLGAFAADCIPLVFADAEAKVCGAAHAGWRGVVGKVAVNVVRAMAQKGAAMDRIRVALGPSIGPCCFEVGSELVEEFSAAFPGVEGLVVDGPAKEHINLRVATRVQLEEVGVQPENIDDTPPCTKCHPSRFFSYRRDGQAGGVHMGYIGVRHL
ncbi:MAG: peptidoglycan editing factor PgeF [Myxococcales bacterium]|nr:peptidoglycan editing factor PgeF [Myxococcales bacterium]